MKIAVLGGNGYLGHHVTKYFNATPLSRRTGFDITKPKDCEQLKDYDVVIHMAALVDKSFEQIGEVFRINLEGTLNVAKVLRKEQVLIFTSTKDISTETTGYACAKACSENCITYLAKKRGFRAGIFRLSTTYAPPTHGSSFVNHFVKCIQEGKEITLLMEGKQKRDPLYVDDLSLAFEKFIGKKEASGVFDIGGGDCTSTTMLWLVGLIEQAVGKEANLCLSEEKPKGQIHYVTDIERISKELSWLPTFSLPDGIRRIIQ